MPVTQTPQDPTLLPPVVTGDTEKMWLEVFRDVDGDPIMDAAKQLPLKPQFELMSVCVYRVERNVAAFTAADWRYQNNTLNQGTWQEAWLEGEAWCEVRWERKTGVFGPYMRLIYTVRCLKGGWKKLIPEAGYAYLDGTDVKDCTTDDGTIAIRKLDAAGALLDNALPLVLTEKMTKSLVPFSFVGI